MVNKLSNYKQYKRKARAGKSGIRPIFGVGGYGGFPHMLQAWGIHVSKEWPVRPIYTHVADRVS